MNIIITGAKGSGKSTAAAKILSQFGCSISGFRTVFENRFGAEQVLYLENLDGSIRQAAAAWHEGGRELFSQTFDELAPTLINPETELFFIDELGFLEKDSGSLRDAVTAAFDRKQNVLAVIRLDAQGWMQQLKSRRDVTVIALTPDNRDWVPGHVLSLLKK